MIEDPAKWRKDVLDTAKHAKAGIDEQVRVIKGNHTYGFKKMVSAAADACLFAVILLHAVPYEKHRHVKRAMVHIADGVKELNAWLREH